MLAFAMTILILFSLVYCVAVVAEGIHDNDMPYVRPPAGSSNIRQQILAAVKSATDPDQGRIT